VFVRTNTPFSRVHILADALRSDPASLPPRRDLLGLGPSPVLSSTWQWIAFPRDPTGALRARRHSLRGSRRARSPSPREVTPLECPAPWRWAPGTRGCGPAATPVLSTDVCCSRMLFSKTIAHVSAYVASSCSHTMRELAVSRRNARFGEPPDRAQGVVFPNRPIRRRTSDAPSPAGFPGGAMSTGVGPRSLARSQVENP